jgi:hypothetical protein
VRVLRAAQFHGFVPMLMAWGRQGEVCYVPKLRAQLVAARTVAEALSPRLTRQTVHSLGGSRSVSRATGPVHMHPIGPASGRTERRVEHPFARVDLVAHPQDQ